MKKILNNKKGYKKGNIRKILSQKKKRIFKKNIGKIVNQKENMKKTNMKKILNQKQKIAKGCIKVTKII